MSNRPRKPIVGALVAILLTAACSGGGDADPAATPTPPPAAQAAPDAPAPVSAERLAAMLLTPAEMGNRFAQVPDEDAAATRIEGCPALDRITGGNADMAVLSPRLATEARVTYSSSTSPVDLTEALGSDTPDRIAAAIAPLHALAECGAAEFVSDGRRVDVTFTGGRSTVDGREVRGYEMSFSGVRIQLSVVVVDTVLLSVSGDPDITESVLPGALAKVTRVLGE